MEVCFVLQLGDWALQHIRECGYETDGVGWFVGADGGDGGDSDYDGVHSSASTAQAPMWCPARFSVGCAVCRCEFGDEEWPEFAGAEWCL